MKEKLTPEERILNQKLRMHKEIAKYRRLLTRYDVKCDCPREKLTLMCPVHFKIVSSGKCPKCDGLSGVNTDYIAK